MNARDRKKLEGYVNALEKIKELIAEMLETEEGKQANLEEIGREDDLYESICEAVDALEEAGDSLQEVIDRLGEIL